MIIILTGMPAVGKSTIGKKIATKLAYTHIDLDKYISLRCNLSINNIFARKGELFFRKLEALALKKILHKYKEKVVLSLGGGTFIAENNAMLCLKKGLVVWLELPIDIIFKRINQQNNYRAILQPDNLYNNLKILIAQRLPFYQKAHLHIAINHYKNHEIVKVIINEYNKCRMYQAI